MERSPQPDWQRLSEFLAEKEQELQQRTRRLREVEQEVTSLRQHNARLQDQCRCLAMELQEASLASDVTHELAHHRDLAKALDLILSRVEDLLDLDKSSIMLREAGTNRLHIAAARGLTEEAIRETRLEIGQGLAGWAAAQRKKVIVPDTAADPRFSWRGPGPCPRACLVAIPFCVEEEVVGVLNVERAVALGPPTDDQLRWLTEFAKRSAVAVENSRLYSELDRQLREMSLLYKLGQELSSSLDLDDLLRKIVDSATELLGCRICSLMLFDERKETLRIHYARGMSPTVMKRVSVRVGEGLAGWVAEQGQPLLIEDIEVHPLFGKKSRAKYSTKSLLSVPLQFRGETLGVLNVNNKDNDAVFTTKDQEVLMMLAGQAAIAFENARLYRELEQLAITDGLTRLYVRRHFLELLNNELRRAQRYHRSLSLLMIDIDHFKAVNDTYGHPQGDQVLQELSGLLRRYGRRDDIVARYGGEEFVVALVETDQHGAAQAAERIRRAVEQHEFRVGTERLRLTLSIGVAGYPRDAGNQGDLIVAADQALYAAKRQGRNRVCLFDPADPGTGMVPVRPPESAPEHQGEEDLSARSAAK